MIELWLSIVFGVVVAIMLAVDLFAFRDQKHGIAFKPALLLSVGWVALALLFNLAVWYFHGSRPALAYLAGYLVEKSLSMDNVFVFALIFGYFSVPGKHQHRALFWGVMGALLLRAVMIFGGVALIEHFGWIIYVFGAFLIVTGLRMGWRKDKEIHPERNPVLRLFRKAVPVTEDHDREGHFFVRQKGRLMATPLAVVVLVIETTDLVFAIDSIPAILGITRDPFIVYTSNIFAICGLRSLYFVLAGMIRKFHHLHYGLAAILVFIGVKMLVEHWVHVPVWAALAAVALLLAGSIATSLLMPAKGASPIEENAPEE